MSCIICGEDLKNKFSISLDCNCKSLFHYECIQSTLLYGKYNKCPYCAKPHMKIPIVNGIKRINPKVHIIDENNPFENKMCQQQQKRPAPTKKSQTTIFTIVV